MKPENWNSLSDSEKMAIGRNLLSSHRGTYLITQALGEAVESMRKVPKNRREVSNIEDMEILLETTFSLFGQIFKTSKEVSKHAL